MLKPYEEYKTIDAKWISQIPYHWSDSKIGFLFTERKEKVSDKDYMPLSVTKKGILPQLATAAKSDDGDNRKRVCSGDFAINSRSDRKGSSGLSQLDGSVSLINIVLKPRLSENGDFLNYLLKSNDFIEEYYRNGRGIVADLWTTRYSEMKNICLPVPPRKEQDQIVRYLDWQVSRINKLIKAKKKQIDLLHEQKQAIINKAVTKGLDDNVPMKDSGVEWIGDIPGNWEIFVVKRVCKILRGKFNHRPRNDERLYTGNYPFIQTGDVARAGKYITSYNQTLNDSGYAVSKEFPKGTLTMTIAANIGDVAILNFDACFPDSVVGFIPSKTVYLDFLYYVFLSMKLELIKEAPVNTQGNLNIERIGVMKIALPAIETQMQIVHQIEDKINGINKIVKGIEKGIKLIEEYKISLISSVVTGKADIRDIAVPDFEVEELIEDVEEEEQKDLEETEE